MYSECCPCSHLAGWSDIYQPEQQGVCLFRKGRVAEGYSANEDMPTCSLWSVLRASEPLVTSAWWRAAVPAVAAWGHATPSRKVFAAASVILACREPLEGMPGKCNSA